MSIKLSPWFAWWAEAYARRISSSDDPVDYAYVRFMSYVALEVTSGRR